MSDEIQNTEQTAEEAVIVVDTTGGNDAAEQTNVNENPAPEQPEGETAKADTPPEEPKPEVNLSEVQEPEQAKEILQDKGFDYAKLQEEFNQKGEISAETRENLAKSGITDEIIDNYIEGQKAKAEKEIDEISSDIGGKDGFKTVIEWAGKNLEQAEINSINAVRDKNVMKIILKDLKNRMDEKEGVTPEYTKGDGGKTAAVVFESKAQMIEAIKDPKYKKDEAYRLQVMKKVAASREAGIDLGI